MKWKKKLRKITNRLSPPRTSTSIVCTILYVVFLSFAFRKLDFDLQYSLSRTILVKLKLTYYRCKSRAQYMDSRFWYTQEDASKVSCQSKCIWTAKHIQIYLEMLRVLFCLLFRLLLYLLLPSNLLQLTHFKFDSKPQIVQIYTLANR